MSLPGVLSLSGRLSPLVAILVAGLFCGAAFGQQDIVNFVESLYLPCMSSFNCPPPPPPAVMASASGS